MFNLRLDDAFKRRPLTAAGKNGLREILDEIFTDMESNSRKLTPEELRDVQEKTVFVVDHALYIQEPERELWNPDLYTGGHFEDVAIGAILLGKAYGLNREELIAQGLAGFFHDVGKYIHLQLYRKKGKFTQEECEIKKEHPWDSYSMTVDAALEVLPSNILPLFIDGQIYHHKRYDLTGYPICLQGKPNSTANILTAMDCMEAMTTNNRPYKTIKTPEEAVQDFILNSGRMFDPKIVEILVTGYDVTHRTKYAEQLIQNQMEAANKSLLH